MKFILNESSVVHYFDIIERGDKMIFDIRH